MNIEQAKESVISIINDALQGNSEITEDMQLIGGKSLLDSMKLVEVCLALEDLADEHGFIFSDEIKGRFLNRWAGVYFCPFANDVGRLCPKMVPEGFNTLLHYSQTTCTKEDKVERFDFRTGGYYEGVKAVNG